MNLQALAAEIVSRVHLSPDTQHNLATMVANLIHQEIERDRNVMERGMIEMGFSKCDDAIRHRTED